VRPFCVSLTLATLIAVSWPDNLAAAPAQCVVDTAEGQPSVVRTNGRQELWRAATAPASEEARETLSVDGPAAHRPVADPPDLAFDEMLQGPHGRAARWVEPPALVVLMSVMEYRVGAQTHYEATSEQLTDADAIDLVADLTRALALLTGNTFTRFAAIRRETVPAGRVASVLRPGEIVVGRYRGLRERLGTIGLGGRSERGGTIRGGSIILDTEYERRGPLRSLLRTHELGHALGYHHVESRVSIMNPRIGSEPTDVDRRAAAVAFRDRRSVAARPCDEPQG
jgi:hypothetical protein